MVTRALETKTEVAYALLRIVSGLMFSFHGIQKIFGVLSQHEVEVGSQVWIGGLIELVTGLAIAGGVLTTWAAFLASGTMAVAYIQFHWKGQFDKNFLPAINQGELALLYSFLFLFMAARGNGIWSLQRSR